MKISKFNKLMTPREVCDMHKWRCPNCGRSLESLEAKIEVGSANESL